jgi:hypothetical protein
VILQELDCGASTKSRCHYEFGASTNHGVGVILSNPPCNMHDNGIETQKRVGVYKVNHLEMLGSS